ncbi:periodic tryptophan protein 1 homolog [Phymastichus coffea]|uniref:periodic tryptophan protein 1 homolog n=1 Tax=Phymastichus coffea TaxID=108790 RepID=UPI00273B0E4A|nr:periodic tryptophan protein 1 homolog [Phymastichus coffea]
MSDDESESKKNHYITCLAWVKRGVAASVPDKVELSVQELQSILKTTEQMKDEDNSDQENGTFTVVKDEEMKDGSVNVTDEFDFNKYDEEPDDILCRIDNIAVIDGRDPFITTGDSDDEDSEKEDDIIKSSDNLLLVGHLKDDECVLEVYVYNEEEQSFYCHHHNDLQYIPLCFEWLNFDPSDILKPVNFCAIGNYSSVIDVWDLDIVGSVDPVFQLGKKSNKKKNIKHVGHKNSVLDIAWNTSLNHILASGSADKTVILWDLEFGTPSTKLTSFENVVQSIKWHETESHILLTGCMDKKVRLYDCNSETAKTWLASGEVERVLWNHFDSNICFISTDNGYLECIDIRQDKALWQKKVQEEEMAGLSMSVSCPGLLLSSNKDGTLKIWDVINYLEPQLVAEKQTNVGQIMCLEANCDSPFTFAIGGDNKAHHLSLFNASRLDKVAEHFKNRKVKNFIPPVALAESSHVENKDESGNTELMDITENMSTINLEAKKISKLTKTKKKPRHRNRNVK